MEGDLSMDNVLNIEDRLQANRRRRELETKSHKVEAVRKLVQCTSCRLRCSMCGCQLGGQNLQPSRFGDLDFALCASCRTDFDDYKAVVEGGQAPDLFWHNEQWMALWSSWTDYQRAIKNFMNSEGFKELMRSLCR
jgi:hypothetical protein